MDGNGELEVVWRGHVGAWRASGVTQRAYCDRHGLKKHSLSYWHLRLARRDAQAGDATPLTLIPAALVPEAVEVAPAAALLLNSPSGWRLEFAALPPAGWLTQLWGGRA